MKKNIKENPVVRGATPEILEKALAVINKKYSGNMAFRRYPEKKGNTYRFTLKVKKSKLPGGAFSAYGRPTGSACWHAHGDFFDAVFALAPNAVFTSRGKKITKSSGNWQDFNIGSIMSPVYASQACGCKDLTLLRRLGNRSIGNPCKKSRRQYIVKTKKKRLARIRKISRRRNPAPATKIYNACRSINPIAPAFYKKNSCAIYGMNDGSILIKGAKPAVLNKIIPGKNDIVKSITARKGRRLNLPGISPIGAEETFLHNFSKKFPARISRLSDGSLKIKSSKRLWKLFDYK